MIDQLEELFTQTIDDAERRAFLRMLVDVAQATDSTVRLVATLRADYFDRPLAYPGFDEAIHGRTVALGAMSSDELADAVRLPASAVGVQIEPGVVDRIVAEAELQPGALPLVQHTLSELFRTRTTNTITVADLDEVGGVAGAIGRRAEQIYQSFDDRGRAAVPSRCSSGSSASPRSTATHAGGSAGPSSSRPGSPRTISTRCSPSTAATGC